MADNFKSDYIEEPIYDPMDDPTRHPRPVLITESEGQTGLTKWFKKHVLGIKDETVIPDYSDQGINKIIKKGE